MNDDNINNNNNKLINIIEINTYIKHLTKQTKKKERRIVIIINKKEYLMYLRTISEIVLITSWQLN